MAYWLIKSEPTVFGIDDLARAPKKTTSWEGVRNYQARNYLREMKRGDEALFYHSSCAEPGVVGIVEVVREAYPDTTAFDRSSNYFDPKSSPDEPRWCMVDVRLTRKLARCIGLVELKADAKLEGLVLVRKGSRLSVMPVSASHWKRILSRA